MTVDVNRITLAPNRHGDVGSVSLVRLCDATGERLDIPGTAFWDLVCGLYIGHPGPHYDPRAPGVWWAHDAREPKP